jgi:hypothetical protein
MNQTFPYQSDKPDKNFTSSLKTITKNIVLLVCLILQDIKMKKESKDILIDI